MSITAKGLTSFKKKDGILQLVRDTVTWTPASPPDAAPIVTFPIASINNLQATPATSAKVMIKIFVSQPSADAPPESYVFNFTSSTSARAEADTMKDALGSAIQAFKAASAGGTPVPSGPGASSTAMAVTSAGSAQMGDVWSKSRLEMNAELQQSLLKSDPALSNTFTETVLTGSVSATQFWSTRTHLLRAHAIERSQARGPYNVLAAIKPTTVGNVARMSLSREQIHDIFVQHPLVKTVYDENVPHVPEDQFWSRFFLSRLFKKLKGEKILNTDPTDNIFDRYLSRDDEENSSRKRRRIEHVPLTLDLEGNEQNHSKKFGNQPDLTMRPSRVENVPIIRTLNSLSQKLVDLVTPADHDASELDMDSHYMAEQRLADLGGDPEEERIILNIWDQRAFFSSDLAQAHNTFSHLSPAMVLSQVRSSLGDSYVEIADLLPSSIDAAPLATSQITTAVKNRVSQLLSGSSQSNLPLPQKIFDSVTSVHATSNEFLHHFWLAFLSGDEKRAKDINNMVASLRNSNDRIIAIAAAAEEEREAEKVRRKKELQEEYKRTGVKPKKKDMEVGGGKKVVEEMLVPTLRAIDKALGQYHAALEEADRGVTPSQDGA